MKTRVMPYFITFLLIALFVFPEVVWAHQTVTVGDYSVEYGWLSEPAIVGQPNAVVVNLALTNNSSPDTSIDISNLKIEAVFGGQTKFLTLQPLGENTPGQFIAPITPMRPGTYTIHLSGNIGSTAFNTDVQPEEIQTADIVQFPAMTAGELTNASATPANLPIWLAVAGILLGATGVGLGALALSRKPARE